MAAQDDPAIKAQLLIELDALLSKVPQSVCNGSVQVVRAWKESMCKAAKVRKSGRASINDIQSAINSMAAYAKELA